MLVFRVSGYCFCIYLYKDCVRERILRKVKRCDLRQCPLSGFNLHGIARHN